MNDDDQKRDDLKRIIGRLHAEEIAAMEQSLMNEGLPAEEIQRLCEFHVAVFENSLENQGRPEKVGGHPIHTFIAENEAARVSLKRLRGASFPLIFPWSRTRDAMKATASALSDFRKILIHYTHQGKSALPLP